MPPTSSLKMSSRIRKPIMMQKASKMPPLKAKAKAKAKVSSSKSSPLTSEQPMTQWKDQYSPPETTNIIRAVFIEFKTV